MAAIDQSRTKTVRTDDPDAVLKPTKSATTARTSKTASKKTAKAAKRQAAQERAERANTTKQENSDSAPYVGAMVWYYRGTSNPPGPDPSPEPEGQPLAAVITHVVSDVSAEPKEGEKPATENRVNVGVFSADGGRYARQNILLFNGVAPSQGEAFVEFPDDKEDREAAQKDVLDQQARVAADQAKLRAREAEDLDHADLGRRVAQALKTRAA